MWTTFVVIILINFKVKLWCAVRLEKNRIWLVDLKCLLLIPVIHVDTIFSLQLIALGLSFGRVSNVLLLKAKKPHEPTQVRVVYRTYLYYTYTLFKLNWDHSMNMHNIVNNFFSVSFLQGFIEMEDEEKAKTFLNYYSYVTPTVR